MSDKLDSRELKPDEAIARLGEALETCRSVVADYRATLIATGEHAGEALSDQILPPTEGERAS